MSLPLAGRRIVVTRARHQAGRLSDALRDVGAEVIELPLIQIISLAGTGALASVLQRLSLYQWLIFTSANAVRIAGEQLAALPPDGNRFLDCKVVAVGPATAEALRSIGVTVSLLPQSYVAEGLVDALAGQIRGTNVLLIRAKIARDVIPETLRHLGARVDVVNAYETVRPAESLAMLPSVLASIPDAVAFTSSSTVRNFVALLQECSLASPPPGLRAISIGPVTSQTLRDVGWEPFAQAVRFDVAGLVEAAVRSLRP